MSCYFLTGGTGVVGSRVLEQLLADPANRIYVLVRAETDASASERVRSLLEGTLGESAGNEDRVIALRGDVTRPRFGVAASRYQQLASDCTRILHSAGLVRMNLPIEQARAAAVGAAEHILALAKEARATGRLEKVEFVSTVGVGGRTTDVREQWIDESRGYHNTYEQAKAEAEAVVRAAVVEGLPVTIHRPSMVVGDSQTGRISSFQVFYHLCEFLTGMRSHGLFPAFGSTRLDTIPVDYVASAIVWSSTRAATSGRILHLCSGPGRAISIADLQGLVMEEFRARGIETPPVRSVPPWMFRAMLKPLALFASEKGKRAIRTAPIFLDYLASSQSFHNHETDEMLSAHGFLMPSPSSYLRTVLRYYLDRRVKSEQRQAP